MTDNPIVAGQDAVAHFRERATALRAATERARAALRHSSGTATTSDGSVTVRCDAAGVLQDVSFSAAARDLGLEALGRSVVAAARRAQAQALDDVRSCVALEVGDDNEAVALLDARRRDLRAQADPAAPDGGAADHALRKPGAAGVDDGDDVDDGYDGYASR